MPEPLMLKIITDADDTGVRKIQKGMGDLEISSHKASHATKEFLRELGNVSDTSDLASVALGSFSKVLAGSLAGTALIIGGKAVIDVFRKVTEIVDKSKESFDNLVEGFAKGGLPKTFQEGATQAGKLSDEVARINKEIVALSKGEEALVKGDIKGWFMGLAATIMDSTNQLAKLREEAKKLASEKMLAGATAELQTARETTGMNPQQMEQYKLRKQFELDVDKSNYETGLVLLEKYNLDKSNIDDKYNRQKEADTRETNDALRKIKMDEFQSDIDSTNRKTELESKAFFEKLAQQKQELEQALKISEAQQKLNDLIAKRIDLQDQLAKAQQNEVIRQGELATKTAGVGGSLRGEGQRSTSFEIGLRSSASRAYKQELNRAQEIQDMLIKADLRKQGGPTDKNAIQREKVRRAEEAEREKARKEFEDPYKKQIEKTTKALQDNESEIRNQAKEIQNLGGSASSAQSQINGMASAAGDAASKLRSLASSGGGGKFQDEFLNPPGGGKTLTDVYTLLENNLIELKTYAHAA
jgi:hypothetical protein